MDDFDLEVEDVTTARLERQTENAIVLVLSLEDGTQTTVSIASDSPIIVSKQQNI